MSVALMVCGLCPSFVVRLCRNNLRTYWADSFQKNSVLGWPGAEPGWKWTLLKKKSYFLICLWIFNFNIRPFGSQNFNQPSRRFGILSNFSEFCSCGPHKSGVFFGFLKFWVFDFSGFFFRVNLGPYGSYFSLQSLLNLFTFFLEFSSELSSQKVLFWIFEIVIRFLTNFWISS